jgi:putative thioredoxin
LPSCGARRHDPAANLEFVASDAHAVTESDFEARVIDRSRQVPVVVDFWAEWCGPCRTLGPALEAAVARRGGEVELAKIDVDANPMLAQAFGIRGIPAVKAFRDGRIAGEFTGAIPPPRIEEFLDRLVPSKADRLAAADDEESLRRALEADPRHVEAARKLGRLLLARGEHDEARTILEPVAADFVVAGLLARMKLARARNGDRPDPRLAEAFAAWDDGDLERALETLQEVVADTTEAERQDLLRQAMVAIFTELGPDSPVARSHRRRLAAALS